MDRGTGRAGEDHVARLLQKQGCEIVARNYHSRFGEIDIIARDAKYIIFVEVKTRELGGLVAPLAAVTAAKRRRIVLTAQNYLMRFPTERQPRFDVAAVDTQNGRIVGEEYLENAFGV